MTAAPAGDAVGASLHAGQAVRVRDRWPEAEGPAHVRTPHYLRGRQGRVESFLGRFADPGELAFGRPAPRRALYHVSFAQPPLFEGGAAGDSVVVEIFEHWLEPL
ncbi:SH3-like domain-containing protein [Roseomonas elaeocarpi]|uniref:SH3-like domain-containing protein n=1 Tax=Roseomonas elaeocarpi TaxID=907779 RepID=A0ABV6JSY8_9PROT